MLVHSVYFWLKDDLDDETRAAFLRGLESLRGIETVRDLHIGTASDTHRPVIDRSYTFGLVVTFDDIGGHDVYQDHDLHKAFLEQFSSCWTNVVIYDFD